MKVTSGYRVEILKLHKPLERTLKVCRDAADWLYPVIDREWELLSRIQWEKTRFNTAEKLIHSKQYLPPIHAQVRTADRMLLPKTTSCPFSTGTTCIRRKRTGYF